MPKMRQTRCIPYGLQAPGEAERASRPASS